MPLYSLSIDDAPVLSMLTVILYIDFLELNKSIENSTLNSALVNRNKAERLERIQNEILAVRCISYMFFVLRCVMVVV